MYWGRELHVDIKKVAIFSSKITILIYIYRTNIAPNLMPFWF